MRFEVLGPLRAWHGAAETAVPAGSRTVLLHRLLIAGGEPVSVDQLAEALWPDDGERPADPRATVQVRVSQLRRALAAGDPQRRVVTATPPGYVLAAHERDSVEFGRAVEAELGGRTSPREHATRLRHALGLWRGTPHAEVADEPWAAPEVARLQRLRLAGLAARIAADLELGRHAAVTAELEALTAEHPLEEGLRALLMTALYRSGRQSDALAVYATVRRLLDEELGVAPGPRLRDLHLAVLRHAVPPPAAPDETVVTGPAHNLPAPVNSFVGRAGAVRHVHGLLAASRIVTLLGPGGIGKTRIAVEAARGQVDGGGDRPWSAAWLVDLAVVGDAEAVPEAIAAAVPAASPAPHGGGHLRPAIDRVAAAVGDAHVLLVLDNCEHVIDAVGAAAARAVTACPNLHVLATSREPLGVAGETCWSLPSLAVPAPDDPPDAQWAAPALRLLVDRATARGAALDAQRDLPELMTICAALDGLPLALELAAAAMPGLGPAGVAAHLNERFTLLTGGRTVTPRHRTLQAALDWSWDLLEPAQHTALAALSVFAGVFDLDAALAVIGRVDGQPRGAAAAVLARLVDKSLVTTVPTPDGVRYRLLQTVRAYAARRPGPTGGDHARSAAAAHADHYQQLAAALAGDLVRPERAHALRRIDGVQDELRAVLHHLLDTGRPLDAVTLLADTAWWWLHGHRAEGAEHFERAVRALDSAPEPGPPAVLGRGLHWAAFVALTVRPPVTTQEWARRAVELLDESGEEHLAGQARIILAYNLTMTGETEEAATVLKAGEGVLHAAQDRWGVGMAGIIATDLAVRRGDLDAAGTHARRALAPLRECGEIWGSEQLLSRLSRIAEQRKDYATALERARDARVLALAAGITDAASYQRARLGVLAFAAGDHAEAAGHFAALLTDPAERPSRESRILAHAGLAAVATDPATATRHTAQARRLLEDFEPAAHLAASLRTLGWRA